SVIIIPQKKLLVKSPEFKELSTDGKSSKRLAGRIGQTSYMSNEEAVDALEEITRLHVGHEYGLRASERGHGLMAFAGAGSNLT
ncbi:MAG: hypothetical protein ACE5JL_12115, partial [Dehalococcoidia bacterium]